MRIVLRLVSNARAGLLRLATSARAGLLRLATSARLIPWQRTPLNRTLLRLALPSILMNLTVPLLGVVDTAVVGHLDEPYYLGAVGLGSLVFTILTWAFAFFRMATVGQTAQALGRGDADGAAHVLGRGVLLSFGAGLALAALRDPIGDVAFRWLGGSAEVQRFGREFFRIVVLAMPATLTLQVFQGWFYGVKHPGFPVVLTIAVNALNIALNLALVWGVGLKSDGVALATVTAQWIGLAAALAGFALGFRPYARRLRWAPLLDWRPLVAVLRLNTDIFLRTASLLFANAYFLSRAAELGDVALAANAVLVQLRHLTAYALDGFASATEVVVGEASGARDRPRLLEAIRLSQGWGVWVGGVISALYGIGWPVVPRFFTSNPEVQAATWGLYAWIVAEPWISNVCFILDGVFIGATATRTMRNSMVAAVFGVFIPLALLLQPPLGLHGLWAAYEALYVARGASLFWVVRRFASGKREGLG
jgi:MATE family multidrug resistance protein